MEKTLGGDRLGSGKKMKVELHNYERSTFNRGYLWRSTMAAGTLVPFMSEVVLPGTTVDIDLNAIIKTHPTRGPLFGSYKVQLDVFQCPFRLYHSALHNNQLGVGLNMSAVKLPKITFTALQLEDNSDLTLSQVNPSSLPAYFGIMGIGNTLGAIAADRSFNAIPFLAYWEIYKNYYANKQEEIGVVIHTPLTTLVETIDDFTIVDLGNTSYVLSAAPLTSYINSQNGWYFEINFTGTQPIPDQIIINTDQGQFTLTSLMQSIWLNSPTQLKGILNGTVDGKTLVSYQYANNSTPQQLPPELVEFPLSNIDDMRHKILSTATALTQFYVNAQNIAPYEYLYESNADGIPNILSSQEGLGIKTYQSDLFNNWLQTEWIDGTGGINEITAVDVSGGTLQMDALILAKKVYDLLNRVAVSGGSYDDWIDAAYSHERYQRAESPIYLGGLSKELVFQEVVSNAASKEQPLGSLAGKGVMTDKHKGGRVSARIDEPSYIIGIISITPRLDYSQGNNWDMTRLDSMDDLHKPGLDGIGFQELITEQMAWWSTFWNVGQSKWITQSAGKQPAWINYMTNVNKVRGNFAIDGNEMWMTLNRKYTPDETENQTISDLTTYIDPSKYNSVFAETQLDAQNFWAQIAVDFIARQKMSSKIMPNL